MLDQKVDAENLPSAGKQTLPPDPRVDKVADINPWTWKSGITKSVVSFGVNLYLLFYMNYIIILSYIDIKAHQLTMFLIV